MLRPLATRAIHSTAAAVRLVGASLVEGDRVALAWSDGREESHVAGLVLRDACGPSHSSGQRLENDIPLDVPLSAVSTSEDGKLLSLAWQDGHTADLDIPSSLLHSSFLRPERVQLPPVWKEDRPPEVDFHSVMTDEVALADWLQALYTYGSCVVTDAGTEHDVVAKLGERVFTLQDQLYGKTFHVRSESNPINVAYSNVELLLHQDLAYYESPPGVQLLHCVEFGDDVVGGETRLVDAFHVAELLREASPKQFDLLAHWPATFEKVHYERDVPSHRSYQRPHIHCNHAGSICSVWWSPPFSGPLHLPPEVAADFLEARKSFEQLLEGGGESHEVCFRLKPGEVVTFNQRRVMHARRGFHGGTRHLVGGYILMDEVESRLRVLAVEQGRELPFYRAGTTNFAEFV